ncbi:hypothetical protein CKAH01_04804 [Colletotrichum kahawae]|uniref:C-type lectin domain-containing protein n=1 Tax=Colletotrichum kahawae TaxID=34407 RepID=A0AAD9YG75_COLKA|nr:hypothetical protein CKAH01_04804 [Colletotrichum kahawae]
MFALIFFLLMLVNCIPASPIGSWPTHELPTLLQSRAPTMAKYQAVKAAAKDDGISLSSGEWYYFQVCLLLVAPPANHIQQSTRCRHHMLLVGSVSGPSWIAPKKFQGLAYHVGWYGEPKGWVMTSHDWEVHDTQKLFFGGKTTEERARPDNLNRLGNNWVEKTECHDLEFGNCLGFYKYMARYL